jgi:hypothetical protein
MQASDARLLALSRNEVFNLIRKESEQGKLTTIYTPANVVERKALEGCLRGLGYKVETVDNQVSNGVDYDGFNSTTTVYRLQISW